MPQQLIKNVLKGLAINPVTSVVRGLRYLKKPFKRNHQCIVIACMPKSGSTYLSTLLSNLLHFKQAWPVQAGGRNEQNLYLPALIDLYGKKTVCQIHLKATGDNLDLIKKFEIHPIILVRNIYDVVVSLLDHLNNESLIGFAFFANDEFYKLDEKQQLDFIIELGVPWYINFYVSWVSACEEGAVIPLWLTYDEVVKDKNVTLKRIAEFIGVNKSEEEIARSIQAVGKNNVRFNKGVEGRGAQILTEGQIQRIKDFTRFYPWVDFSRIGI